MNPDIAGYVIITVGDWQIYNWKDQGKGFDISGVHNKCGESGVFPWGWVATDGLSDDIERCFNCQSIVPPEIVTLIKILTP